MDYPFCIDCKLSVLDTSPMPHEHPIRGSGTETEMTAFNRQLSAAQRQYDNASPDESGDARDEWIDERATALTDARMADHEALTEAVEEVIGDSDTLAGDMAAVLAASDAAFEAEAVRFFVNLFKRVREDIRDAAEADAEYERRIWESEQAEMRNGGLGDVA